ncbi:MAG TPA: pyridoxal phosphate-dependent aminotransferase [Casimicrobiaceae bacterium]|nr:pyridoxal phosphate-dependent aminotransferase [Casimicrobiaceae bacterium]
MPDIRSFLPEARAGVRGLAGSKIRDIANAGMHDPDVLAFWFGEPDQVTPEFIRDAATASLARGETFYSQNFGIPELRAAIADYVGALHRPTAADHIAVTASGMSALMLAVEALVGPGDRVVVVTPLWPNLVEIPKILSADVVCVPLSFGASGWQLDLERLLDALTPGTRALMLNSPNNPTGWTIDRRSQRTLLAHCARHGIWIVADDVYERLYYAEDIACAPSLLDIADDDMRVVSTNSFSKAWLMTGWRLGWIVGPKLLIPDLGKLIEYNTSCSPVFVQRAGVAALRDGEPTVDATRERLRRARNRLVDGLRTLPGIDVAPPEGAMYAFFRVDGVDDSMAFCRRLVQEAKLGLAPGSAFGPEGEGFVRWCFAASDGRLDGGIARLARFLEGHGRVGAKPKLVSRADPHRAQ